MGAASCFGERQRTVPPCSPSRICRASQTSNPATLPPSDAIHLVFTSAAAGSRGYLPPAAARKPSVGDAVVGPSWPGAYLTMSVSHSVLRVRKVEMEPRMAYLMDERPRPRRPPGRA